MKLIILLNSSHLIPYLLENEYMGKHTKHESKI